MKILIYTLPICPFCTSAKNFLALQGVEYEELVISTAEERAAIKAKSGMKTAPIIYFDGELVGGFEDMMLQYTSKKFEIKDGKITWNKTN